MLEISNRSSLEIDFDLDFANLVSLCLQCTGQNDKQGFEISLSFVDEAEIQSLNNNFRQKDKVTDVLSFPDESPAELLGDLVICVQRAQEQADELGHSLKREIAFLFVHGLLHLLGYDHETSLEDEKEMFALQDKVLAQAGIDRL